jgi:hypothetical protein
MTARRPSRLAALGAAAAAAWALGCGERLGRAGDPRPQARPAAYLSVSDADPAAGGLVRVTALTTPGVDPASFTARLTYDPAAVRVVREDSLADGALRAVHVAPGVVRVAGVAPRGLAGRPLFALTLRVHDSVRDAAAVGAAVAGLRLELLEMHDARRADLRPVVRLLPTVTPGAR